MFVLQDKSLLSTIHLPTDTSMNKYRICPHLYDPYQISFQLIPCVGKPDEKNLYHTSELLCYDKHQNSQKRMTICMREENCIGYDCDYLYFLARQYTFEPGTYDIVIWRQKH